MRSLVSVQHYFFLFFTMARAGNVFQVSKSTLPKGITLSQIFFTSEVLLVTFFHTKTIQFGQRALQVPLLKIPHSPLCPVKAFLHMCSFGHHHSRSTLFLQLSRKRYTPLTKKAFINRFRTTLMRHLPFSQLYTCEKGRGFICIWNWTCRITYTNIMEIGLVMHTNYIWNSIYAF